MNVRRPTTEDRLHQRLRPDGSAAMFQAWRNLLFLHWEVNPAELAQHLPAGLHLDLHDARAYVGIVPFFMCDVRPRGLPAVPGLSNFLELNVRTYVHDDNGVPGVWFFSLDANNRIACAIARSRFHLPYTYARMSANEGEWIDYRAERSDSPPAQFRYRGIGEGSPAEPDSLEFFLLERYILFAHDPKADRLFTGRVHHEPYLVQEAGVEFHSMAPLSWDGITVTEERPVHQCFAKEVTVELFPLQRCR